MSGPRPDDTPTPDYKASLDFLDRWISGGPWTVVAIDPNKKAITAATFGKPTIAELRAWLEDQGTTRKRNCYFAVNTCKRMTKKPTKADVIGLNALHVDVDPRAGEDIGTERERILALLTDPTPLGIPKPSCIVNSGGGFQAFWRLKDPRMMDPEVMADAEARNKHLELALGGDACWNADRIMRLPGTVNWPDAKKRAKGRVPALASVVEFNDFRHDLEAIEKAAMVAAPSSSSSSSSAPSGENAVTIDTSNVVHFASVDDIKELQSDDPLNAQCRVVIVHGFDPDNPDKFGESRSEWLLFVCCQMHRAGCADEAIYSVITNRAFGVSMSVLDKGSGIERYALRQIEEARKKVAADAEKFQADKHGVPYKNLHNARLAVRKLGITLEYDEFAERSLIAGLPGFGPQLDDAAVTRMRLEVEERFRIQFGKDWFADFITDVARQNRRHPVREFLDGLEWDRTPRLDGWMTTFLGVEASEYTRAIGTLVLIAAVRRIRHPGCKFDEMLVLEGDQGSLKSTALKVLAVLEDWFSDDLPLNAKSQQFIEQTVGKWIVEAGELKGMRKGDIESLKACLSRSLDRARMAYGRLAIERPRQFVIIGTTNSRDYLKDGTGNRRYWPVRVGEVKVADLRRDRDQLWAEAAAREAAGVSIRLDPSLYEAARTEQEARRVEDPYVDTLGDALSGVVGKLRAKDAWAILGVPDGQRTQDHNQRFGEAMRALGWERKSLRFGGNPEGAYVKGDQREREHIVLEVVFGDWGRVICVRPKDESGRPDDPQAEVTFK